MSVMENLLSPLPNKVIDAQQVFRAVLKAMSEPATVVDLTKNGMVNTENGDAAVLWAVAQSLIDGEVTVLCDSKATSPIDDKLQKSIRFFCGSPAVEDLAKAEFVFTDISNLATVLADKQLNIGTLEMPHTSSTLVVFTEAVHAEDEIAQAHADDVITLSGAGIKTQKKAAIAGMTAKLRKQLQGNNNLFPLGVDMIFCSANKLVSIPRTSHFQADVG